MYPLNIPSDIRLDFYRIQSNKRYVLHVHNVTHNIVHTIIYIININL